VTGFPKKVRAIIEARAKGICERCQFTNVGLQIHHRRPRGMGGSKDPETNRASNGVLLCPRCHEMIERFRREFLYSGWLVLQGKHPAETPIWRNKQWVRLDDDGGITEVTE